MPDSWIPTNTSIEVDIQRLEDFATLVQRELNENLGKNVDEGITPMLTLEARFGDGTFKEGSYLRQIHDRSRTAVLKLLADLQMGLMALSTGAQAIARDYAGGDALSSATMDDVRDAFHPLDQNNTLQGWLAQASTQPAGGNGDPAGPAADEEFAPWERHYTNDAQTRLAESTDSMTAGDEVVIAEGKPGEYVIQADDDNVADNDLRPSTASD